MQTIVKDNKHREVWIDIIRIILTILVVVGHSTYYDINTPFGGIHYNELMVSSGITDSKVHYLSQIVVSWIYSFHMPLFIALSGILFNYEYRLGKYKSVISLVKAKAKRLLIPCCITWMFFIVPIKYLTHYYDGATPLEVIMQLIFCKDVHIWFLQALFGCFIICYLISDRINIKIQVVILSVLCVLGICLDKRIGYYVPFGNPFKYSVWFWIGMRVDKIEAFLKKYVTVQHHTDFL